MQTPVSSLLHEFFDSDPITLPTLSTLYDVYDHANLQVAIDAFISNFEVREIGIVTPPPKGVSGFLSSPPDFSALVSSPTARLGSIDLVDVQTGPETYLSCMKQGLLLLKRGDILVALWIRTDNSPYGKKVSVDAMARDLSIATRVLEALDELRITHSTFKGKYVRFDADRFGNIRCEFENRPRVLRDELILPRKLLSAIEQHTIELAKRTKELTAANRHLKRGLLLYGPPGTGKTLTIKYLASTLQDSTLFVLTGSAMVWLKFVVTLAGEIGSTIIVLDDIDLIAEDRNLKGLSPRRHLFDLFDAMDGLEERSDVLFVGATNRIDAIETAIAARPGRVDQALEVPLPDAECRSRLIQLYSRGLNLQLEGTQKHIERTEGVTASFIKELMRRAAVTSLKRNNAEAGKITVTDNDISTAMDVLLNAAGPLKMSLLNQGGNP